MGEPEIRFKSGMPDDHKVVTHHDLCLALGGDDTSFTGDLLRLIAKGDPENRARLRRSFPGHVAAWRTWVQVAPAITAGELRQIAEEAVAKAASGGSMTIKLYDGSGRVLGWRHLAPDMSLKWDLPAVSEVSGVDLEVVPRD